MTAYQRSNWIWLAGGLSARKHVLEIKGGTTTLTDALTTHFSEVTTLCPPASALHAHDATSGCVTLHGVLDSLAAELPSPQRERRYFRLFQQTRRVLRPGGCLYVGMANPNWHNRVRNPVRAWASVERLLRKAGFVTVHAYHAEPSYDHPSVIIPTRRAAVVAYETTVAPKSQRAALRFLFGRIALHRFLYPGRIYLAYV
ncbi:MAG: hypothetical protein IID05_12780 [Gemmatimonadetes bacterium]|nr:hypothetical protein [Gemmatimonadota bacterium]